MTRPIHDTQPVFFTDRAWCDYIHTRYLFQTTEASLEKAMTALSTWEDEAKRHRTTLTALAKTEWQEDEPNSRADLPEDWQRYIEEMEAFANHWIETAKQELEKTA